LRSTAARSFAVLLRQAGQARSAASMARRVSAAPMGYEVVMYAMGLIDTGYRFGGKNPEAGLDCSGMVSYIYGQAAGLKVARAARPTLPAAAGRSSPR
jgi:cell wall-associated NlpC family hydrolase